MSLIHQWLLESNLNDSAGSNNLSPITDNSLRTATDTVYGITNQSYMSVNVQAWAYGASPIPKGVFTGSSISSVSTPSLSFVFRQVMQFYGCSIRFESGSYFGTNNQELRIGSTTVLSQTGGEYDAGVWYHIVFAANGANTDVYLDGSYLKTLTGTALQINGIPRIGAYSDTAFEGTLELYDVRVYDHALSSGEITTLNATYGTKATADSWYIYQDGSTIGGFTEYSEEDTGTDPTIYSYIETENDTNKIIYGGGTCIGMAKAEIPYSLRASELWGYYELFVPTGFDQNHDFGSKFTLFLLTRIYGYRYSGSGELIWAFYDQATAGTNIAIEPDRVGLYSTGGNTTPAMAGTAENINYNAWNTIEWHIDPDNTTVQIWVNGNVIYNDTSFSFTYPVTSIAYGMFQGVHPEDSGNYLYQREMYVGEIQYSEFISTGISLPTKATKQSVVCLGLGV